MPTLRQLQQRFDDRHPDDLRGPDDDPVDFEDLPLSRRRRWMGDWHGDQEMNAQTKRAYYEHFVNEDKDDINF